MKLSDNQWDTWADNLISVSGVKSSDQITNLDQKDFDEFSSMSEKQFKSICSVASSKLEELR